MTAFLRWRLWLVLSAMALCLSWPAQAAERVIVVQPAEGKEGIERALLAAREMRRSMTESAQGPIRIVLRPGEYVLSGAIVIRPEDSGTAQSPTIIEASPAGSAVFVGAPKLSVLSAGQSLWRFAPSRAVGRADERAGGQFFVNARRAVLAQQPDPGAYFFVDRTLPADDGQYASKSSFLGSAADVDLIRPMLEGDRDRAIVTVMQSWTSGDHRLSRLGQDGSIVVAPAAKWPFLNFGHSQRYVLRNLPKALNAPGEWVLTDGAVHYLPRSGERPSAVDARWPRVSTLLHIKGEGGRRVEHLELKGLAFSYTGEVTPMAGWVDQQAAVDVGAAVVVDGARHVRLLNCKVSHTGGYGIWLRHGVQDSEVSGCVLDDLGAGGIKVGEKSRWSGLDATHRNVIADNHISRTGQDHPGAVGIWVGQSSGNSIVGNVISRTSYSGISVGWQWGYADSGSSHNVIARNVLFDIGQSQLSDMGAIYTLGRSPGTEISGNFIRQVEGYPGYGPGAWGIYNDEGSTDLKVSGNVVVGTQSGAYHLHYGKDIEVSDNLFSGAQEAEVRWTAPAKSGSWQLSRNFIMSSAQRWADIQGDGKQLRQVGNQHAQALRSAPALRSSDQVTDVALPAASSDHLKRWRAVIADARTRVGDERLLANAPPAVRPDDGRWWADLALMPVGARPLGIRTSPAKPQDVIRVVIDDVGERAMQLQDGAPGLLTYDPHIYFRVSVTAGRMVSRFSVLTDTQSELVHEWRDGTAGYNIGPKVTFLGGAMKVGDKVLAKWPVGAWIDVAVEQDLASGDGRWILRWKSSTSGQQGWHQLGPFKAVGPSVPKKWNWVGWYANGTSPSRTLIKNIVFERSGK